MRESRRVDFATVGTGRGPRDFLGTVRAWDRGGRRGPVTRNLVARGPAVAWGLVTLLCAGLVLPAGAGAQEEDAAESPPRASDAFVARAVEARGDVVVDGRLDEPAWEAAPVIRDFRQIEPLQGAAPTLTTEVRILYDRDNLYVGIRAEDPQGPDGIRVPEARRNFGYFQNDLVGISLDGFGDGRSAMAFQVNAMGALRDLRVLDGAVFDREWQGVWEARTAVDSGGWTAEVRIPWSTLRYDPAAAHWRMLLVRRSRRINEEVGWPEWPREHNAYTMRFGGRLEGLEPPLPTRNVEIQPYLAARSEGDPVEGALGTDRGLDVGGEVKWGLSSNTVLDLTVNTDFAEADVDRQVVNLTRFSVFFPEQRPFFLENAGLFRLVDGRWVEPFFSRRIGLDDDGTPIPLQAGARMTHQSSRRSAGGLLVRQGGDGGREGGRSASTFGVGRYQHNLGEFNRVGGLVSTRIDELRDGGRVTNTVGVADWYLRPRPSTWFRGMVSGSHTDGVPGGDGWSAFGHVGHRTSWGYLGWVQAFISPEYRASSGFIPRSDLITTSPVVSLDLRPDWLPHMIRSIEPGVSSFFYHRVSDRSFREGRVQVRPFDLGFADGASAGFWWEPNRQELTGVFSPLPGLEVEPGSYRYDRWGMEFESDPSQWLSGAASWSEGGFFDGRLRQLDVSGRVGPSPRWSLTAGYERNEIRDLGPDQARLTTHLISPEARLSVNPRLQLYTFYQHNTAAGRGTWNARFSWEFAPLSFLHVVFNDGRPVGDLRGEVLREVGPSERQFIVKLNYLMQR